uniref:Uncharacterized protein n=1 Tax=Romanomermis culicivorax TaxID=13658 RepID=A0A915J114_ROMCU
MEHLVNHGCPDDKLAVVFDVVIQKTIFGEENRRMFCSIACLEGGNDFGNSWMSGLCLLGFFMGGGGCGFNGRGHIVGGQWHVIGECGLTDEFLCHCMGDSIDVPIDFVVWRCHYWEYIGYGQVGARYCTSRAEV